MLLQNGVLSDPLALRIQNLADNSAATAAVTITAANNASMVVPLGGSVCDGNGRVELAAKSSTDFAKLGPGPYRLKFELTVAGERHAANLVWNDDNLQPALDFVPPLQGLPSH